MLLNFDRDFVATYLRPHRPRLALLALLLGATIALQLANPQLARTFVDRAAAGEPTHGLLPIALAFLAVAVLAQVAAVAETYVAEDLGWRTTNQLRADLTRHILALDDSFHSEHGAGELIERIDGDVGVIAGFFARFVVHVIGSAAFLAGVLVLLWREDWRVGALLTATSAAALTFMLRGGAFVGRSARKAREANAEISAFLEERLDGLPDIKANGGDSVTMRAWHQRLGDGFRAGRASFFAGSVFNSAVTTTFVAGAGAALAASLGLYGRGVLTVGAVFMVYRYTSMLRLPLAQLARHMNSFQQATGGIVRVRELLSVEPKVVDGDNVRRLPEGPLPVELDAVGFAYEKAEQVLHGVSVRIAPGEVLGLLGRTGSGKTTISRLLFRLHDVTDGAIRVGGIDVRDASLADLRARVAMVTQDVQLFAGTLRDNVTLFDERVGDERLHAVFSALDLDEWLDELPEGLDTELGLTGRGLSAGEAQLVALARVFLKNPGVVVLDEASSRLDPHTEALLEHAIDRLLQGRTGIVIAHRLATVQRADSVLVLDRGRVAEHGRRVELAADPNSRFAQLLRTGMAEALA